MGQFCPTAGAATFAQCTMGADGCFTVMTGVACTAPLTCNVTPATMLVAPPATACGCSPVIAAPTATTKLLNTGCTAAQAAAATRLGSPGDDLVLVCQMVGTCPLWQLSTNCALQQLTGGTFNSVPACVCKDPARWAADYAAATPAQQASLQKPNQYYVDPNPPMATQMNGPTTGAVQPPACRFPTLKAALAKTGVTEVVAFHESSSNVHFVNPATGLTDETFPMSIPNSVRVYTADIGSFNPDHYTLDIPTVGGTPAAAITLGSGSSIEGYTIDASGTTAANAGTNVSAIITTPSTGATTGTLNQDSIRGRAGQTGVLIQGEADLTVTQVPITGTGIGIQVNRTAATGTATLTGTWLTGATNGINSAVANATGVLIGPLGGSAATISGVTVTLSGAGTTSTGISLTTGGTLTATGVTLAVQGTGISNTGGTATVNGSSITANPTGVSLTAGTATVGTTSVAFSPAGGIYTGYRVTGGTLAVTGGSVTLPTVTAVPGTGSNGLRMTNGTATLSGVAVTVGGGANGVLADGAAQLTVNGASVVTTSCKVAASDCDVAVKGVTGSGTGTGILVSPGVAQAGALVTIGGTTQISGFLDGINSGDGSLSIGGTVSIGGNVHDGVMLTGVNANTVTAIDITGATVNGNGNDGLFVSTNVTTVVTNSTLSSNQANGVRVAQSQNTIVNGAHFTLTGSTVSTNGNATGNPLGNAAGTGPGPDGRGVLIAATDKVGAVLQNNHIDTNVLEGVRVQGVPASATLTEVVLSGNHVTANLTGFATAPAEINAGGIFFASDLIKLSQFVGNRVFANGRNEIGFAVAQAGGLPWDLSSGATGIDPVGVCTVTGAVAPNYVYCYGNGFVGVSVTTPATIPVKIKGMHWAGPIAPAESVDFSTGIVFQTGFTTEPTTGVFLPCAAQAACVDVP